MHHRATGPAFVNVVINYVTPVTAAVVGWVVLDERLGLAAVAGFLLVAVGSAAMQWVSLVAVQARMAAEEDHPGRVGTLATAEPVAWEWGVE